MSSKVWEVHIDASSFCEFDGKCNKLVNLQQLTDIYHSRSSDTNICTEVDVSDIDRNSVLLTVSTYIASEEATYEQIDTDIIRQELAKQQKLTDFYFSRLENSQV